MKVIKEIGLEGIADFKKSKLPIAPGVTYLYGRNDLDNGNPNAAGKSVAASAAADIFYDTPMVGTKQDRPKVGMRSITWKDKRVHRVVSRFEGNKEKLRYWVDGEVAEHRTTKATRELVRKAWGVSEDDYRTYGYLYASTPHPLVRGSSTERKAFFTSFFQLDKLDAERKVLAKRALELKRVRAQHTELDKTFREIKQDMLTRDQRQQLEQKVASIEKKLSALRSVADKAQRAKSLKEFEDYAKPHLKALRRLVPNLDEFSAVHLRLRKQLRRALDAKEQAQDYEVYLKELAVYKKRAAQLDMSKSDEELEDIATRHQKAKTQLEGLAEELRELQDVEEPKKVNKPVVAKDTTQAEVYRLRHELQHLEKFKKGVCRECGQPVKVRPLTVVQEELSVAESELKVWKKYEDYKEKKAEWDAAHTKYNELKARRKKLKALVEELEDNAQLWSKRSKLEKPTKVEKPEAYQDPRSLETDIKVLEFFEPHVDRLKELEQFDGKVQPFDFEELDRLQEKLAAGKAKLEVHNTVKSRAGKIRKRLRQLEEELADEEPLALALTAYSDKNVKKMAVDEISRRLMATVTKYAAIVFDGYSFEFVWGSQIQMLVHRPKGTTDVRKLSGAESVLFTLILIMSQLMFVPKSRRLSLLILDEPSASFSAATLEKFHKLLPHLLQLIPSILIVTPKSEERFAGATEYTVVRNASGAEIRKGHPSEI